MLFRLFDSRIIVVRILIFWYIHLFLVLRSAILQLPDLFVSAVIPDEEESGPEERNEAEDLEVYRCPVFMNRVSFSFQLLSLFAEAPAVVK